MSCTNKDQRTREIHDEVHGELLVLACPVSKVVLSAFKCEANHDTNVDTLNVPAFTAKALQTCAKSLGIKVQAEDGKAIYKNKGQVADRIVRKVMSLFSSVCGECSEHYHRRLSAAPSLLSCHRCFRGSHDCDALKAKLQPFLDLGIDRHIGSVWLCQDCFSQSAAAKPYVVSQKKGTPKEEESVVAEPLAHQDQDLPDGDAEDDFKVIAEEDEDSKPEVASSEPAKEKSETSTGDLNDSKGFQTTPPNQRSDTCNGYKHGNCPHGLNGKRVVDGAKCSKAHPHHCYRWRKAGSDSSRGCTEGKNCRYFHPIVCKLSAKGQRCDREGCSYMHVQLAPRLKKKSTISDQKTASRTALYAKSARGRAKKDTKVTMIQEKDFYRALQSQQEELQKGLKDLRELVVSFQPPTPFPCRQWPDIMTAPQPQPQPLTSSQAQAHFLPQGRKMMPIWNEVLQTFVPSSY